MPTTTGSVTLPERVTVLTCSGCGGMGREERCLGGCSEHKLVLVGAEAHAELCALTTATEALTEGMAAVVRALAGARTEPTDARDALETFRERARAGLRAAGPAPDDPADDDPRTVTAWWCAECGNVDFPRPCLGLCDWRPRDWVNRTVYDRQLAAARPAVRSARRLHGFLVRTAGIAPHPGQWERNWDALRSQARDVLATTSAV